MPLKRCKHFELGGDKKRKVSVVVKDAKYKLKYTGGRLANARFIPLFIAGTNDPVLNSSELTNSCVCVDPLCKVKINLFDTINC
jgi:hypothetical protein